MAAHRRRSGLNSTTEEKRLSDKRKTADQGVPEEPRSFQSGLLVPAAARVCSSLFAGKAGR
jgi:hypothetical protein